MRVFGWASEQSIRSFERCSSAAAPFDGCATLQSADGTFSVYLPQREVTVAVEPTDTLFMGIDGVLYLLRHFWEGDMHALEQRFRMMGFGTPDAKFPDHEVMRQYHDMILEPIKHDAPFDFSEWAVHGRIRAFMRENFELIRLVPPAGLILNLRVLAGLKGQMTRMKANINLRALAEAQCRRKGVM